MDAIDLASTETSEAHRDTSLPQVELFNVKATPQVT